jgi:hypothetical protein
MGMTSPIVGRCTDSPCDAPLPRTTPCIRHEAVWVLLTLACGAFAACHTAIGIGKRDGGGDGGADMGGSVGFGGTDAPATGWRLDGATGFGGSNGGTSGWRLDGGTESGGRAGSTGGTAPATSDSGGTRRPPTGTGGAHTDAAGTGGVASPWDGGRPVDATPVPEPVDNRPPRPAWTPPFTTPVGTPGWQQSTEPLCDANQGAWSLGAFDVWADHRGVFALVGSGCQPGLGVPEPAGRISTRSPPAARRARGCGRAYPTAPFS